VFFLKVFSLSRAAKNFFQNCARRRVLLVIKSTGPHLIGPQTAKLEPRRAAVARI
jgi:hypothetical protein